VGELARSWKVLIDAVERLARVSDPSEERLAGLLASVEIAPLISTTDIRFGTRSGVVVLEVSPSVDRQRLAESVADLGPAVDLQIVSPPILDPGRPDSRPEWDRKHGVGHDIGGRRVWFGMETTGGVERLVSISIHYERPEPEFLPPEGDDGLFRLTVSVGWCGGHGEAVLTEDQAIRTHDDLPIFVDDGSMETILGRVDLGGSWLGSPVIRVRGRGRLERRKGRNSSIPGAPKERYVALVVTALSEARVDGEKG